MTDHRVTVESTLKALLEKKKYAALKDVLVTMNPSDVAEVFEEIEDEFISHIPVLYQNMSDPELLTAIGKYTMHLQANADTFRAIVRNGNLPEKFSSQWIEQRIMSHGTDVISVNKDRTHLIYTCSAAGITALYLEWINSPSNVTPEELAWIVLRIFRTGKDLA